MQNVRRNRTARRGAGGALFLLLTLFAVGCGGDITDALVDIDETVPTLEVAFSNDASNDDSIHIFGPGEEFDASNRLNPGEVRRATFRKEDTMTFTAGRNGQVFARVGCEPSLLDDGAVVLWEGGALICGGTFR